MRRELNREHKRRVEAGLNRMLAAPIDMLRSVLNASSLGAAADIPKRTATACSARRIVTAAILGTPASAWPAEPGRRPGLSPPPARTPHRPRRACP